MGTSNLQHLNGQQQSASSGQPGMASSHAGPAGDDEGMSLDFSEIFDTLWRGKWIVVLTAIVVAGAIGFYTHLQTPIYRASSIVKVDPMAGSTPGMQMSMW